MVPNVLTASACNGSLGSKPTKSSKLTGEDSCFKIATGHHKFILKKYTKGSKKLYNAIFPPPVLPSFTSSLNVPDNLFLGDTSQAQVNNTQGILCLQERYLLVGRSWKKNWVRGLLCPHPYQTQGTWAIVQLIFILNISGFGIILSYNKPYFPKEWEKLPIGIKGR
jgi:hypothetical protein